MCRAGVDDPKGFLSRREMSILKALVHTSSLSGCIRKRSVYRNFHYGIEVSSLNIQSNLEFSGMRLSKLLLAKPLGRLQDPSCRHIQQQRTEQIS